MRPNHLRRREFITLLGGAAAVWPLAARAQQRVPVIGFLHSASPEPYASMMTACRQGLAETGYVEGRNVAIEYRWAEGQFDRLPALAAELVRREVAVMVASGGDVSATAAKHSTTTIPIVFTIGSDPTGSGLVNSLSRPEGNVTGVSFFTITLGPKRLELLRELVPKVTTMAMLVHPGSLTADATEVREAARAVGQPIHVLNAASDQDIDAAFRTIAKEQAGALLIISNPLFTSRRDQIVALANHYRIPACYPLREYVVSGGLMSYGASIKDAYRQTAIYTGRILKGAKPSDLPVTQPTKFEFVINLRTAKTLGLDVPPKLLALADEVIE